MVIVVSIGLHRDKHVGDWQARSVRGFMSGALKKRLQIQVISQKDAQTGERRYFVAPLR